MTPARWTFAMWLVAGAVTVGLCATAYLAVAAWRLRRQWRAQERPTPLGIDRPDWRPADEAQTERMQVMRER